MSNLRKFSWEGATVRVEMMDGQPWWVAKDVCEVLGIVDAYQAVSRLDDDERGTCIVPTPGGRQEMAAVSESGLYALIFTSRKPEARQFRKWVTSVVLPELRQRGSYGVPTPVADGKYVEVLEKYVELLERQRQTEHHPLNATERVGAPWSQEEGERLWALRRAGYTWKEVAHKLGRTWHGVRHYARTNKDRAADAAQEVMFHE